MAKSLAQIRKQIDSLKRQAEHLRKTEVAGVIARMKEAIRHYALTPEELGFGESRKPATKAKRKVRALAKAAGAKYKDSSSGRTWTGRGRRPQWFIDALAAGKKAEELAA